MSSKRKTKKPIRVFEIQTEFAQPPNDNLFPVLDSPEVSKSSSVFPDSVSDYHDPTSSCTISSFENEQDQDASWDLSLPMDNQLQTLPTMVNPATGRKWPTISNENTSTNNLLSNGKDDDPLLSGTLCSPPKKTRKIRYKNNLGEEGKYRCHVCEYTTNRSDHHKRHIIIHSDVKPLKCVVCGYGTGRSDHFRRHLSRHNLSEEEITNQCRLNGIRTGHLRTNRGAVPRLGDGDADAVQQKCSTNHNTASDGVATNLSAADKRFSCVLCGYSTDRNSHYVRHVKTHTDVKPYQCERCGKSFKLETYLRKHRCAVKASAASGDVLEDLLGAAVSSEMRPGADSTATPADAEPNICACGAVFENLADLTSHILNLELRGYKLGEKVQMEHRDC